MISRVTAAAMEPRGAVGDYSAAADRYTLYTPTQRPHGTRAQLATMLHVPESKVRIVTGDTGGSFGMKTIAFNEGPLTLLASKLIGRPVKWISTRTEAFLSDPQGRDHVTEAELALDQDGVFLAMRVKIHSQHRRLSAARHAGLHDAMPARSPASIARPQSTPTSAASSPIPIRCGPTAATAGRKRPS